MDERTNRTFYLVEVQHDELTRPYSLDADVIKSVLVEGTNVHRSRPVIEVIEAPESQVPSIEDCQVYWEAFYQQLARTTSGPGWPD